MARIWLPAGRVGQCQIRMQGYLAIPRLVGLILNEQCQIKLSSETDRIHQLPLLDF